MEKYEINKYIERFSKTIHELLEALKLDLMSKEIQELELQISDSDFWNNQQHAQKIINEMNHKKKIVQEFQAIEADYRDLVELLEIDDSSLQEEIETIVLEIDKKLNEFEIKQLLNEEHDKSSAILELHPGAGGTESQDWGLMLYRMYTRWALKNNFKVEILDYQDGDEAGIKSVTLLIKGEYAFGYLKCEKGVHRLVRISPFDSNARRHTSFASVEVTPELNDDIKIVILEEDIKVDVFRSSGAGGQSVNTTDSAVRITHKPSGLVVNCQNERSQIKNREKALSILKSKLYDLELKKQENLVKGLKSGQMENGFGSQIRSYVFHPYSLVKDHRTEYEVGNASSVIDGNIDEFINSYLKYLKKEM